MADNDPNPDLEREKAAARAFAELRDDVRNQIRFAILPAISRAQRPSRLVATFGVFTLVVFSIVNIFSRSPGLWKPALLLAAALAALRISVTVIYKTNSASIKSNTHRISVIEKIGLNAAFAKETIDALRLSSSAHLGHLPPDIAASMEDDPFMKETWQDANRELQRLYSVLGSPPMKARVGARDG